MVLWWGKLLNMLTATLATSNMHLHFSYSLLKAMLYCSMWTQLI